jgi:hypothetical protein
VQKLRTNRRADVPSWHIASVIAARRHVRSWGQAGSDRRAVREGRPIADPKLEALRQFAAKLTRQRGMVNEADIAAFKAAITATLLFNQFAILRSRALLTISIGYPPRILTQIKNEKATWTRMFAPPFGPPDFVRSPSGVQDDSGRVEPSGPYQRLSFSSSSRSADLKATVPPPVNP